MRIRSRLLKKRNEPLEEFNSATSKKLYSFKLPDSDDIGLKFIDYTIKYCSNSKLYGIQGKVEAYSDSKEKQQIIEMLKKEFEKRGLEYK